MRQSSRIIAACLPASWTLAVFARRQMRRGELELRLLNSLVDRGRPSVDAGANLGVYSYWLSKLTPKVYAFEPHPEMAGFLRRAKLKNVELHEVALSDHDGQAAFTVPKLDGLHPSPGHGTLEQNIITHDSLRIDVTIRELDNVIGDGDVGFIKADVEGHELAMLRGARRLIKRCKPVLLIEIQQESYKDRTVLDAISEVEAMGYHALFSSKHGLRPAGEAPTALADAGRVNNFIFQPV